MSCRNSCHFNGFHRILTVACMRIRKSYQLLRRALEATRIR